MRIVLDTNVILSALLWRGVPHRLHEAIRRNSSVELFTSAALLDELVRVLARPFAVKRLSLIGVSCPALLADYVRAADIAVPLMTPAVVAEDPDDDHVIAAAVAANADFIVSGDRHLLKLDGHGRIGIVNPTQALAIISPAAEHHPRSAEEPG